MYSYALKRITRDKGLFLALFVSVVLSATLFSGILQGADTVGGSLLSYTQKAMKYDVISTAFDKKNVTETKIYGIDSYYRTLNGVEGVDHFLRMDIELNSTSINGIIPTTIVAVPASSELAKGINAPQGGLEDGKLYMDLGSMNATKLAAGWKVSLGLLTYKPRGGGITDFIKLYFPVEVGSTITIDDQTWSILIARSDGQSLYNIWINAVLSGNDGLGVRPSYNLVVVTESTFRAILDDIYRQLRAPTIIRSVVAIRLSRTSLINQWDDAGTQARLQKLVEQIDNMGRLYGYIPRNYLAEVLNEISAKSATTKLNTIIVTTPVFFTAWYLGMTVSDVSLGLRRKEIGLLLVRGMNYRQVYMILLYESFLIGLISGVFGIVGGAAFLPFIFTGADFAHLFMYVSPLTLIMTLFFSLAMALLAAYGPVRRATQVTIVDALRDYSEEEERLGGWGLPLAALLLGLYKLVFLLLGGDITSFRPTLGGFLTFFLYSTWYGVNYMLDFIWTILLFWGFTKLFLMYVPQFQSLLGELASKFVGDLARVISLSNRRSLKRTATFTFLSALIICYSVIVIGNASISSDYTNRFISVQIGADASVLVYKRSVAFDLANRVKDISGVESAAAEISFTAMSSLGSISVRAIDLDHWNKTSYMNSLYIDKDVYALLASNGNVIKDQFGVIQGCNAILERGAAKYFGIRPDGTGNLNIEVESHLYNLKVIGLFGRDLGENWVPQNPTIYLPIDLVNDFDESRLSGIRVIVKLNPSAEAQQFVDQVKALGLNVQRVDVTSVMIERFQRSAVITGSQQEIQLGIIFAALVSSVGVVLINYTMLRSRVKELKIMSVRGCNNWQLSICLISESFGLVVFAAFMGIVVGVMSLFGQVELYNKLVPTIVNWRFMFPLNSQLQLLLFLLVLVVATVMPVIFFVRRITEEPKIE
jgi:ABC-type antimicrobial peptide transport system permease subunit